MSPEIPRNEIDILRRLAERKVTIANDPVNLERRQAWYRLDTGNAPRPMILAESAGVRDARRPAYEGPLHCQHPEARRLEYALQNEIWTFEHLRDDHVVEPVINVKWSVSASDYGVTSIQHQTDGAILGARSWDPPLKDLRKDLRKLRPRTFSVNRDETYARVEMLENIFNGILEVRIRGGFWWTFGLTITAIDLIGLENLMLYMFDQPDELHQLMAFLRDDHLAFAKWAENEGLLTLNNENDYIGSGSMGYTPDLPGSGWDGHVRTRDLWLLLESQETVGVGPAQFEEFVFPYQQALAEHFGKIYYGCCEPLHSRIHIVKKLKNLARVSVSPWADEEIMAKACGQDLVYSRKPNPTLISTRTFDEDLIREDLKKTLCIARNNRLEIIMKDVHTLNNEPERLARWVEIAREVTADV